MKQRMLGLLLAVVLCAGLLASAAPGARALDLGPYESFLQELRIAIRDKGLDSPKAIYDNLDAANVTDPVRFYLRCIWSDSQNDDLYQARFALRDLDGNGVPELLLACGEPTESTLSGTDVTVRDDLDVVYTIKNSAVTMVADFDYRDMAAVYGNVILNHGSGGAMFYDCSFKTLAMDAITLHTVAEYDIIYETYPPQFYRNYYADKNSRLTAEQVRAMHSQYTAGAAPEWHDLFGEPFIDVDASDWFYQPVLWAVNAGVTNGMYPDLFCPNWKCTRGQVVTFLWRAAGEPEPTSTRIQFVDVAERDYYYKAVLWAVEKGITLGTSRTTFDPGSPCTRGQVVTFLWRACGEKRVGGSNPFTDVAPDAYYYDAVLWAVDAGVTNGLTPTTFGPDAVCTRAQVVTFLYRLD